MPRLAAVSIAIAAWAGLAVQFAASYSKTGSVLATVWVLLRFFTVLTNLLLAIAMTRIAVGGRLSSFLLGGLTLAILLVGAVYMTLLRGLVQLEGLASVANTLLHYVTPVAAGLYWLAFSRKGELRWRDPFLWILYPLAYFAYALVRGAIDGRYPYPFIDVVKLGAVQTALNAAGVAAAFLVTGLALVAIDRAMGLPRSGLGLQRPNG